MGQPTPTGDRRTAGVQSVQRIIELLEALADSGGEAALIDLAARTSLPSPTVHRLMKTLLARGYVRRAPSRKYALGPRLVRIGNTAAHQFGADARPSLTNLAHELGESTNLAVIDRDMAVYVAQASSTRSMRMFTEVGRRVYTHSTGVGKAILAQLEDEEIRTIVAHVGMPPATPKTITTVAELMAEVTAIRKRGYAIDDGEQELGVRCFALAIPGAPTPTALSISGPDTRVNQEFGERAVIALRKTAAALAPLLH